MKILSGRRLLQRISKSDDFLVLMPDAKGRLQIISPREVDRPAVARMLEQAAVLARSVA